MRARVFRLCAAAGLAGLLAVAPAAAFSNGELVGQWFTELQETGTYEGEAYTIRKQIEDNRADGTKTVTFRFYDNCRYVGELVNVFDWGVEKGVYWAKCRAIIKGAVRYACETTEFYDLLAVTGTTLDYRSRRTGIVYKQGRVGADFKIPPSACVSQRRPPHVTVTAVP